MFEERHKFFDAIESKLSSASLLLSEPEKLKIILNDLEFLLQEKWPTIFSSLTDYPLSEKEKNVIQNFLKKDLDKLQWHHFEHTWYRCRETGRNDSMKWFF